MAQDDRPRGPLDPPAQGKDEDIAHDDVRKGTGNDDDGRSLRVLRAAQVTLADLSDQDRNGGQRPDAKVGLREPDDLIRGAERTHDRAGEKETDGRYASAQKQRQPQGLHADCTRFLGSARAQCPGHSGCHAVSQEREDPERSREGGHSYRKAPELRHPQMSHESRVDDRVEGVGCESAEGRDGQAGYDGVVGMPPGQDPARDRRHGPHGRVLRTF